MNIQNLGKNVEAEDAMMKELGDDDFPMDEDHERLPQDFHDDWLADNIDFSDEEDLSHSKGYIANAPMYQQHNKPGGKKNRNWMPERKGGLGPGKRPLYLGRKTDGGVDFADGDPQRNISKMKAFDTYLTITRDHHLLGLPKGATHYNSWQEHLKKVEEEKKRNKFPK